jgi:putative ABC transport system permease protein
LGASVQQIAGLHIGFFMRLVLISNIIALPLGYFAARTWLDTFAYRTDLTQTPFIIVAIVSFLLVIFSGGYSAWKSGRMNPIDVIKIQ